MFRSLSFYRRRHWTVAAGAAVACAVLTGALLVGDSVRGSLRELVLERLGAADHALVAEGFFRERLAAELSTELSRALERARVSPAQAGKGAVRAVPLLMLEGTAVAAQSRARASRVTVLGVEEGFSALWDAPALDFEAEPGAAGVFPPVVLNEALQRQLGVEPGDAVVLSFGRAAAVPRGSLLGRRDAGEVLQTLRLTVAAIVPTRGPGAFSLAPSQVEPLNAFVPIERLQRALERPERVNAMLLAGTSALDGDVLAETLRQVLTLEDLGLAVRERGRVLAVENDRFVLRDATADAVAALAAESGATVWPLRSYLANTVRVVAGAGEDSLGSSAVGPAGGQGGKVLAYAAAVGMGAPPAGFGELRLVEGGPAPEIGPGEALLNAWAAERLGARVGDLLEIAYYRVGAGEQLTTERHRLRLAGIVAMTGLGADPGLTPDYPGISDTDDIADWDPPFPVDLDLVTPEDEAYWDRYRGAPKLFVAAGTARELWSSRYGDVTALRLAPAGEGNLEGLRQRLASELPRRVSPAAFGLVFEPVRARALAAAVGATDFAQLFVAFSWFLILAAALLVALLFGLGVEQRAAEVGLLRAVGFSEAQVRRRFLAEGVAVGALGCAAGLAGALGYAALMMLGLRTWWLPAVGSRQLELHVTATSLAIGFFASLAVVALAIAGALRRLRGVPAPVLLAGSVEREGRGGGGRGAKVLVVVGSLLVFGLLAVALGRGGGEGAPGIFFGIGAGVLVTGLALFSLWCRARRWAASSSASLTPGLRGRWLLAVRNSARNPGRSVLSVTLVACACFVIVTTAANRRDLTAVEHGKDSGTGGFALVARSDVPLFEDLNDPEARFDLGLPDDEESWLGVQVMALRRLPGDDASCLNLYRPERPQVLGVPAAFRERGGFHFHATASETEDPWQLLEQDLGRDEASGAAVIPAIADYESATWILKLGLGDDIALTGSDGEPLRLRLVGLLDASLFQSEVLVAEEALMRHFPELEGFTDFLVQAPPDRAPEIATGLEAALGDFGFDATSAAERLASFKAVQNTYLSTFQTLGGLGLLLGTLGLAVILLRNVNERRAELAALRAFGFRRALLRSLILQETVFLLLLGMALGSAAALVAVTPYLSAAGAAIPWVSLAWTLAAVLVTGTAACAVAAGRALRGELLPGLRGE